MFAVKWIRDMGDPLLSEQVVKMSSPRRLAQLLEAYASVNELDAVDVTLSLTDHDSVFVRRAARCCLEVYGRNAKWSVRRVYENTFEREPEEGEELEDLLARLYERYDGRRSARSAELFARGVTHGRRGDLEEMSRAFRELLRDRPMFAGRHEMAAGFLAHAEALAASGQADRSLAELRLALRVAEPGSEAGRRARARLRWLEAERFREGGVADPALYRRVLEADPAHEGAREMLALLTGEATPTPRLVTKAALVSFVVFLAALLVLRRARGRRAARD